MPCGRDETSGDAVGSSILGGAQNWTLSNAEQGIWAAAYRSRSFASRAELSWSSHRRSSPFTLKIRALVLRPSPPSTPDVNRLWRRNVAYVVLVATPEIP